MRKRSLLPQERQEAIHRLLRKRRYASVRELASDIEVSPMTVRRDLDSLEASGAIRRVFGGAQAVEAPVPEQLYSDRLQQSRQLKERIASLAAESVRDGDTVALDGSTTAVYLARELRGRSLTVVTNNLLVANELASSRSSLYLTGGMLRTSTHNFVGSAAVCSLRSLNVDTFFFSLSGLHEKKGFTDSNPEEIELKRALFDIASHRIALVDSSKFGRTSLHELVPPGDIERLLTDRSPPASLCRMLESHGIQLGVASE